MKFYTGKGDFGKTDVFNARIRKDSKVINAIGLLDELNAFLGHAHSMINDEGLRKAIKTIERHIYLISAELTGYSKIKKLKADDLKFLEYEIERHGKNLSTITKFVYPNGTKEATILNICRALTRRAESSVVSLGKKGLIPAYLNRLSSLLFVLFRAENGKFSSEELLD